jgi:hypothetical protein
MADSHQENRLPHCIGDVLAFHHGLRHPGKARELVDHSPDVVDLTHDRIRALLEDVLVLGDDLAELAADALGGKLDRGQRILDFMRDTARDVAPRRGALGGDQFGDVVQGDDIAVAGLAGLFGAQRRRG